MIKDSWIVEVTDTFGGCANYSWINRAFLATPPTLSRAALVRRAKRLMGWTNRPCSVHDYGEQLELRPRGACVVMFITHAGQA